MKTINEMYLGNTPEEGTNLLFDLDWWLMKATPEYVTALAESGADVNEKDGFNETPLVMALGEAKDPAIFQTLIDLGADVNSVDNAGSTPLFKAVSKASQEIIQLLLNNGADINAENENGETPLARAKKRNPAVVEYLIAQGAKMEGNKTTLPSIPEPQQEVVEEVEEEEATPVNTARDLGDPEVSTFEEYIAAMEENGWERINPSRSVIINWMGEGRHTAADVARNQDRVNRGDLVFLDADNDREQGPRRIRGIARWMHAWGRYKGQPENI